MRTLFLFLTVVIVGFIAINRQRLYLRDPLAAVYRNDIKQEGAQVFINYSNDVLVQRGDATHMEQYLVQGWNSIPGIPAELKCVQGMACLAPADHAPMVPIPGALPARMTNRQVSFTGLGTVVRVVLR